MNDFSGIINEVNKSLNRGPLPRPPSRADQFAGEQMAILQASTSNAVCARIRAMIENFEKTLSENEEVGIALASFGVFRQLIVTTVLAVGTNMVAIGGIDTETGREAVLLQHISQLSFLLVPEQKTEPDMPRRRIGFGVL
ncbi:MAG: DUF6173 family protein [Clostridia bacterium]